MANTINNYSVSFHLEQSPPIPNAKAAFESVFEGQESVVHAVSFHPPA